MPGTMEMSPAWFSQGNNVSYCLTFTQDVPVTPPQGKKSRLYVSKTLLDHDTNGSLDWVQEMQETTDLLNAILSIVHPELHQAGAAALEKLRHGPRFNKHHTWARAWNSVYSGVSVIANRACVPHRDIGGRPDWFDLILTLGQYSEAIMRWPDLRVNLDYPPGTVVFLAVKLIRHQVLHTVGGERLCLVWFMRDLVHDRLRIPSTQWADYRRNFEYLHAGFLAELKKGLGFSR